MKFRLGALRMTRGVDEKFAPHEIMAVIIRHASGDWGEIDQEDVRANEEALIQDTRLMSVYSVNGEKVWVITEADRSGTTVLLPDEY